MHCQGEAPRGVTAKGWDRLGRAPMYRGANRDLRLVLSPVEGRGRAPCVARPAPRRTDIPAPRSGSMPSACLARQPGHAGGARTALNQLRCLSASPAAGPRVMLWCSRNGVRQHLRQPVATGFTRSPGRIRYRAIAGGFGGVAVELTMAVVRRRENRLRLVTIGHNYEIIALSSATSDGSSPAVWRRLGNWV
jgi:hypothetical protein